MMLNPCSRKPFAASCSSTTATLARPDQRSARPCTARIVAMPDRCLEIERELASTRRRLDELREDLGKPFEHEARLTALAERQRALAVELDLDKDGAGTQGLEASGQPLAAGCCCFGPPRLCGGVGFPDTKCVTPQWTARASLMSQDHLVDPGPMICLD